MPGDGGPARQHPQFVKRFFVGACANAVHASKVVESDLGLDAGQSRSAPGPFDLGEGASIQDRLVIGPVRLQTQRYAPL